MKGFKDAYFRLAFFQRNNNCPFGLGPRFLWPEPALSRCNRCSCIGPRTSGGPAAWCLGRSFIFARYTLRLRIQ